MKFTDYLNEEKVDKNKLKKAIDIANQMLKTGPDKTISIYKDVNGTDYYITSGTFKNPDSIGMKLAKTVK